jgi:putative transposase
MTPPADTERDKNHRCPGASISHGVGLSSRCTLSSRDVAELLCARGIMVSHEAIRHWCHTRGQDAANRRRRRPQSGDTWHLDEVFVTINGERHSLWRAADQDENVLDMLVQRHRNTHAAKQVFRTLLKGVQDVPRVVIASSARLIGIQGVGDDL